MQAWRPHDYVYLLTSRANPEHWPRLLKLIGREDLIGDARYDTPDARLKCEAEVDEIVTQWTKQRTKHEAMAQLSAVEAKIADPALYSEGPARAATGSPPGPLGSPPRRGGTRRSTR